MKIWLSPTKLNLFKECMRCGYDEVLLKTKRARSPFPSLPNGIDAALKVYMDRWRGSLPPELKHLEGHRLMDEQSTINTYREWNGLKSIRNVTVSQPTKNLPERKVTHTFLLNGAIDDALYNDTKQVVVFDVKTRKDEPDEDYGMKYYQTQVNSYAHMFKMNGYEVADYAYLWYWWPLDVTKGSGIQFGQKLLKMPVDFKAIPMQLDAIAEGLPAVSFEALQYRKNFPSSNECDHCTFVDTKNEIAAAELEYNVDRDALKEKADALGVV